MLRTLQRSLARKSVSKVSIASISGRTALFDRPAKAVHSLFTRSFTHATAMMSQAKSVVDEATSDTLHSEASRTLRHATPIEKIEVDVIVPVHNSSATVQEAVESAMSQVVDKNKNKWAEHISVFVCCFDDGSTDDSWKVLQSLEQRFARETIDRNGASASLLQPIPSTLAIQRKAGGSTAGGAGYARNRAVQMRPTGKQGALRFLCMLDSDDTMHRTRIMEQVSYLMNMPPEDRSRTLLGCTFNRDPPDATWHYAQWANGLTDERLTLERFREVTLLQPTWMMMRSRFLELGGYIEALPQGKFLDDFYEQPEEEKLAEKKIMRLIHPAYEHDLGTLRVAEDIRFFCAHNHHGGILRLLRSEIPLVTYRHVGGSQSSQTPRRLLLHLRALAFTRSILDRSDDWQRDGGAFCVWGAGRDGKDFVKALDPETRKRVYCMVDVDEKKINLGYYVHRELGFKIPVVHFSMLIRSKDIRTQFQQAWCQGGESEDKMGLAPGFGKIDKGRPQKETQMEFEQPPAKKRKLHSLSSKKNKTELDFDLLTRIPVVVCVALNRTNGALEYNVKSIGRTEGEDLFHFS